MSWALLDIDGIEALHREQIARFGGSHGLRDRGLLKSAISRPENRLFFDPDVAAGQLAAALGWGLIKNHPFVDGNKRIGIASMVAFLHGNGFRFACTSEEETAMAMRAAASEISEEEWTAWVERSVAPVAE